MALVIGVRMILKIKNFDKVTSFRLYNLIFVVLIQQVSLPVLIKLRGLLSERNITLFIVASNLAVKTNKYMVKNFTLSQLYKIGVIVQLITNIMYSVYFYDKTLFIYFDFTLGVFDVIVFYSYSVKLDVYLTDNFPASVEEYRIYRNNLMANMVLLGLFIFFMLTSVLSVNYAVGLTLLLTSLFSVWSIWNWNYFNVN